MSKALTDIDRRHAHRLETLRRVQRRLDWIGREATACERDALGRLSGPELDVLVEREDAHPVPTITIIDRKART